MRRIPILTALVLTALALVAAPAGAAPGPADKPAAKPAATSPTGAGGAVPAGSSCRTGLCGRIVNATSLSVYVARDWNGTGEIRYQNTPPYPVSDEHPAKWLSAGDGTGRFEDWDTFRVDAGWKYEWTVYYRWGGIGFGSNDRRGSSTGAWIRVHNDQVVHITSQYT